MSDHARDAAQDNIVQGISFAERQEIRRLTQNVITVFAVADANPVLAFTVIMNVLGSLIGQHLADEADVYQAKVVQMLPYYVQVYREGEKRV